MKKFIFAIIFILFTSNYLSAQEVECIGSAEIQSESSESFCSKGIYLSFWAAGSKKMLTKVMNIAQKTEVNAIILDIKNEYGYLSYRGDVKMAEELGAYKKRTIKDIDLLISDLKNRGLYVIGRIVVFKDDLLANSTPALSIKNEDNKTWINRENLAWVNPFIDEVQDYNIAIAKDAALRGFDEINFDYIRFPASTDIKFETENNQENRINAISDFLKKAKDELKPLNVAISVDTYGYALWNKNDTGIGHKIEELAKYADYISPMLYPSGFHLGIPNFENPVENPYEIVYYSLMEGFNRTKIDKSRFRPWLQAFKDYGFDRRMFKGKEIKAQIDASEDFGTCGWMLWHPASYFIVDGLEPAKPIEIVTNSKKIQIDSRSEIIKNEIIEIK